MTKKLLELKENIYEYGILEDRTYFLNDLMLYSCAADKPTNIVINPDGGLKRCASHISDNYCGNVFKDDLNYDIIDSWKPRRSPIKNCYSCAVYPICKMLLKCPAYAECDEVAQIISLTNLRHSVFNMYYRTMKDESN